VIAMRVFGSFLMMFVLAVPMVRDCCLPVIHSGPPCHESTHRDDATCASNEQAVAETKTTLVVSSSIEHTRPIVDLADPGTVQRIRLTADAFGFVYTPTTDIYLRTGALLI
jgi:hypothetical protein